MRAFWFAPESPRPLCLMRIGLGLGLFYEAALHWPYAVELYSTAGLPMPLLAGTPYIPPVLDPVWTVGLHTWLLFALLAIAVGWCTRFSLLTAFVLSGWFALLDSPATMAKYTVIGLHLLLLLSLTEPAALWSLDHLLRPDRNRLVRLSPAWPRRLMQLLLCSVYWGAAVTKLRLPDFATGDVLMFSLLDDRWGGGTFGLWLATQPTLLALASLATVLFEFTFPVLVWVNGCRRCMLVAAVLFHAAMGAAMTIGIFSPLMFVALLAFVDERDLPTRDKVIRPKPTTPIDAPQRRRRIINAAAYVLTASILSAGGLAVQQTTDHPDSKITFKRLDAHDVDEMYAAQLPAFEDYFHQIELGSRVGHARVFGEREQFRRGMHLYVFGRLLQSHPPMTVDVILVAPTGQEVARSTHRMAAGVSHLLVPFELTESLPAGPYRAVVRAEGYEVLRRGFEVVE